MSIEMNDSGSCICCGQHLPTAKKKRGRRAKLPPYPQDDSILAQPCSVCAAEAVENFKVGSESLPCCGECWLMAGWVYLKISRRNLSGPELKEAFKERLLSERGLTPAK